MNVIPMADFSTPPSWIARSKPCSYAPERLAVGVRPESVHLADDGVPARITAIEYLGADSLVEASAGTSRIVARMHGKAPRAVGDSIFLAWDHGATHWFDLSSGRRTT
jgi:sn-glycerol 3-phosphate transport system ATP-binding protein